MARGFFVAIVDMGKSILRPLGSKYKNNENGRIGWNVCTWTMAETTPSIHTTACSPDSSKLPETKIEAESDSMVRITVGDKVGWVSSYHLIVPKENQLINAWLAKHRKS